MIAEQMLPILPTSLGVGAGAATLPVRVGFLAAALSTARGFGARVAPLPFPFSFLKGINVSLLLLTAPRLLLITFRLLVVGTGVAFANSLFRLVVIIRATFSGTLSGVAPLETKAASTTIASTAVVILSVDFRLLLATAVRSHDEVPGKYLATGVH
jgi:hypothetical protein